MRIAQAVKERTTHLAEEAILDGMSAVDLQRHMAKATLRYQTEMLEKLQQMSTDIRELRKTQEKQVRWSTSCCHGDTSDP